MKNPGFIICTALLLSLFTVYADNDNIGFNPKLKSPIQNNIPGRFLIEYTTNDAHSNDMFDSLKDTYQAVSVGDPVSLSDGSRMRSVHNNNANEHDNFLQTLVDHENVVAVYPVTYVARPASKSNGYFGQISPEITEKIQAHGLTQVDQLHKEGWFGKGVRICVLDTGIDYMHPALGGGFGPGYKISFGADLVGDDYDPMDQNSTALSDNKPPLDNCSKLNKEADGHGTHVVGIIAGNDTSKGFIGVSPDADIGVWRVFGCNGGSSSEIIMKAMIEAQKAKCDVINMSLGNGAPWSELPHAAFAQKLAKQGISVVVSNGNNGEDGAFTVTDPAGAHDALTVAAATNPNYLGSLFSLKTSTGKSYGPYSYQVAPEANDEFPDGDIVLGGTSDTLSACESDTINSNRNLKGKLALVKQGPCQITEQANRLAVAGAIGLVYFNTQANHLIRAPFINASIPIATISSVGGHHMMSILKNVDSSRDHVHVKFERDAFVFESATANTIAYFSSVGPTVELDMKPSFAALGSDVYSTLPQYLGGWGTKSGTSMATPYVTGVVALMRQALAEKNLPSQMLHEKLQNYGKVLNAYKAKSNQLDSPLRQGAGLIQAYDAIKEPLHISPSYFSFNDTRAGNEYRSHSLKITNTGDKTVEYKVISTTSASISSYGPNNTEFRIVGYNSDKFYTASVNVDVTVDQDSVELQPGESKQIRATVHIPAEYDKNEQIMYGGFIQFQPVGTDAASAHVPYFGVLGSLYDLPTFKTSELSIEDQQGRAYGHNDTFKLKLSDQSTAPTIGFHLLTPSRRIVIDLIDSEENRVGFVVPTYNYAERSLKASSTDELNPWTGKLTADGNINSVPFTVNPGLYRVRWSALRMFGDLDKSEDWVIHSSCELEVVA
ncbi:peptidase S8/S53 domain-containing protein [Parasitella parasitica]|nr:peptidase S8/S53 domain-containing protein [Parasitella parasitica]